MFALVVLWRRLTGRTYVGTPLLISARQYDVDMFNYTVDIVYNCTHLFTQAINALIVDAQGHVQG